MSQLPLLLNKKELHQRLSVTKGGDRSPTVAAHNIRKLCQKLATKLESWLKLINERLL
jgi:hypothetical protein